MTVPFPSLRVLLSYVSPEADLQCPIPSPCTNICFPVHGETWSLYFRKKIPPVGYLQKVRICHFNGLFKACPKLKYVQSTGVNKPGTKDRTRYPGPSNLQAKRVSVS